MPRIDPDDPRELLARFVPQLLMAENGGQLVARLDGVGVGLDGTAVRGGSAGQIATAQLSIAAGGEQASPGLGILDLLRPGPLLGRLRRLTEVLEGVGVAQA